MTQHSLSPRQTICFALDTSQSMDGEKIKYLNDSLSAFFRHVKSHQNASVLTDVSVVTFGREVRNAIALDSIAKLDLPHLSAGGATPLGEAVKRCLEQIEDLQANSLQKPTILVLATDGYSTDDIGEAVDLCHQLVKSDHLVVFPIAIGDDADVQSLGLFSKSVIKDTAPSALVNLFTDIAQSVIKAAPPLSVFDRPSVPWNDAMGSKFR